MASESGPPVQSDHGFFSRRAKIRVIMRPKEAEKILNAYGGALGIEVEGEIARPKSRLPYSKSKIKYAFYSCIEGLIERGLLNDEARNMLVVSYAALDSFVDDQVAKRINETYRKTPDEISKLLAEGDSDAEGFKRFGVENVANLKAVEEINEYIDECYKELGKE